VIGEELQRDGAVAVDTLVPSIRWRTHFAAAKIDSVDTVVVGSRSSSRRSSARYARALEWKTYLRWQLAHSFAPEAGGSSTRELPFFGTILNGALTRRPLEVRSTRSASRRRARSALRRAVLLRARNGAERMTDESLPPSTTTSRAGLDERPTKKRALGS
jgi:hypothetical protein